VIDNQKSPPTAAKVSLTDDLTDYKNYIVPDTERELHIIQESNAAGSGDRVFELVRREDLREKWECQMCGDTFRWDRNHEEEFPTCPGCASTDTERVEEGGENPE